MTPLVSRRTALSRLSLAAIGLNSLSALAAATPKKILLRSSWQTVNIGDIAHTPGVLAILEEHLPDVEITLWPSKLDKGVDQILKKRFPKLKIAQGGQALSQAFKECDFLLHSSGASFVAERDVRKWVEKTSKPFGVYGITLPRKQSHKTEATDDSTLRNTVSLLSKARFVYFRDSVSLGLAKELGCTSPVMEFGPDGAFACDLRDDDKANAFLKQNNLTPGRFLCCIPRLRYTPYWTIPSKKRAFDPIKHARNEEMKENDHAQLRKAIIAIVKQTDHKVLICPEDQTQMKVGKDLLYDPLPKNIRERTVWRPNYWLTGEAISIYRQSVGLFGNEMHSPIMCIGNGIPAIVCRWAEQTSKGYMWRDIGLNDWLFNTDEPKDLERIVPTVLAMAKDPTAAKRKALKARAFVQQRQKATMLQLANEIG